MTPAPGDEGGPARATVLRLSLPGADPNGGPPPHPVYGGQLNPEGVPGVPGAPSLPLDPSFPAGPGPRSEATAESTVHRARSPWTIIAG